jgi:hypothetical protein
MKAQQIAGSARASESLRTDEMTNSRSSGGPEVDRRIEQFRVMLGQPAKVAAAFWLAGAGAALGAYLTAHWTWNDQVVLLAIAGICMASSGIHFWLGARIPQWALHIGAFGSLVLVTLGAAVGQGGKLESAVLYVWILVFAALYFSPLVTLAYAGGVGIGYAVALTLGPKVQNPVASWLAIVGTGAIASAIVLGLVSVLRSDARQDHLTGLANRRLWDERLEGEMERSKRTGASLSVAVIDLDGFKEVNDREGHDVGDHVLQKFAATSRAVVRGGGDLVARLGVTSSDYSPPTLVKRVLVSWQTAWQRSRLMGSPTRLEQPRGMVKRAQGVSSIELTRQCI